MTTLPEPITHHDRNFFHEPGNNGFLGDFVEDHLGRRGRIYDCHFGCPESDAWLAMQDHLGDNPMSWRWCRWVSILVDNGGAVVIPEQLITTIGYFELDNDNKRLYFRD